jgi:beta-phosphoglucomutase-like phosphatase (HAD superfamily)
MYKGIIFDFNGTLFWDSDLVEESWRIFAKKLRNEPLTDEEIHTKIHGRPNKYISEYLLQREITKDEMLKFIDEKEGIYRDLCRNNPDRLKLASGAEDFLDYLVEKNIPHTIATSAEITNVKYFIQTFNLKKWFDPDKIILDDGTHPGKPEPDAFLKAAKNIRLNPKDCIVFEDAPSGLTSAYRAGIGKIIAVGAKENHNILQNIKGVDFVISDFNEFDRNLIV